MIIATKTLIMRLSLIVHAHTIIADALALVSHRLRECESGAELRNVRANVQAENLLFRRLFPLQPSVERVASWARAHTSADGRGGGCIQCRTDHGADREPAQRRGRGKALSLADEHKVIGFQMRLEATAALPVIARALGPDRTRDELLPFLAGNLTL